jgi:hypothetical protein
MLLNEVLSLPMMLGFGFGLYSILSIIGFVLLWETYNVGMVGIREQVNKVKTTLLV